MLRIYQGEFSYFTGPNSFYPEKIIKGEPPNIKKRPNKQSAITDGTGSKEEDRRREAVMREFYFTNIVRELAAEHTPAYHQITRMKFEDFTAIMRFLFWCFFARSLIDILRCFLAR